MSLNSTRTSLRWFGLTASAVLMFACDSNQSDNSKNDAAPSEVKAKEASEPGNDAAPEGTKKAKEEPAPGGKAGETEKNPGTTAYSCADDSVWTKKEYKALQTGALEDLSEGIDLPQLEFKPCEGTEHCESLSLTAEQKLLAVGQNGNDVKLVVSETCGDNTAVLVAAADGKVATAFRGKDMAFESAVVGGDRFLLSGFARHRSETAKDGFVPREYLVTGREGKFAKLEPARNKLEAVPVAAASQIVQVKTGKGLCTTMFWKLGVEQCDFEGPASEGSVILGSQMIYPEGGKGMKWNSKEGSAELLPSLEWIVTDGVNVHWSTGSESFLTQPKYDLPKLESEPLAGAPGERPLAFGCGRSLVQAADGFHLRNLKLGSEWVVPVERFGPSLAQPLAMDCDSLMSADGKKFALKNLGGLQTLPDKPGKEESAKTPEPTEDEGSKAPE